VKLLRLPAPMVIIIPNTPRTSIDGSLIFKNFSTGNIFDYTLFKNIPITIKWAHISQHQKFHHQTLSP
jgi:hypothetical protein